MEIAYITELNSENLTDFLKNEYVLIDIYAIWCGPCRMISPIVDEISNIFQGRISVGKLNADENKDTLVEYGVRNIPTILLLKNGEVIDKNVGMTSTEKLTEFIEKNLDATK
jgi:thioredoxin 1